MNSDGRSRRRELVEEAYHLQVKAGLMASRHSKFFFFFGYDILVLLIPPSLAPSLYTYFCFFGSFTKHYIRQSKLTPHDRAQLNMAHSDSARQF
jgi:hypothetical protein